MTLHHHTQHLYHKDGAVGGWCEVGCEGVVSEEEVEKVERGWSRGDVRKVEGFVKRGVTFRWGCNGTCKGG